MIGYLTKDKNGYKLHDKDGTYFDSENKVYESYSDSISFVDDRELPESIKQICNDKPVKVLIHLTPIAEKYESKRITEVKQGDKVSYKQFNCLSWLFGGMIYGNYHDKYITTIQGIDWYNCKYLVQKHNDKCPKWYDWSDFEFI